VRPSHRDKAAVAGLLLGCGLVSAAAAPAAHAQNSSAPSATADLATAGPTAADAPDGATYGPGPARGPLSVDDDPLRVRALPPATTSPSAMPRPAAAQARAVPAYVLPVRGYHLSARFGDRGTHWGGARHTGLDFVVPSGTPVHVVATGRVAEAGWAGPYGRSVVVAHADGALTRYAHLSSIAVSVGERLAVGVVLGRSGATGNVTGPHLHLEVIVDGTPIDPFAWLTHRGLRP